MAAAAAATAASGASNILSSGLTAGLQILGNTLNNQQQYGNTLGVMGHVEDTFAKGGLPKYMAYMGNGSSELPQNRYQVSGGNFYSAGPVNSNLPLYTTTPQQYTHSGAPRFNNNVNNPGQYNNVPPFNNIANNNEMRVLGQNDRVGLGNGRYNIANNFVAGGVMTAAIPRNAAAHQQAARLLQ